MRHRRLLLLGLALALVGLAAAVGHPSQSHGATPGSAIRVTTVIPPTPVTTTGKVFLTKTFTINYTGGIVTVAGDPAGVKQIDTDDVMRIQITHADATSASYTHDYSANCTNSTDVPTNPVDLTSRLKPGVNTIQFTFADKCGGSYGQWETWLTLP